MQIAQSQRHAAEFEWDLISSRTMKRINGHARCTRVRIQHLIRCVQIPPLSLSFSLALTSHILSISFF